MIKRQEKKVEFKVDSDNDVVRLLNMSAMTETNSASRAEL